MARQYANPECASLLCPPHRGRHTAACLESDGKCEGCLPRLAADGIRLCRLCRRLLEEDPGTLAQRFADLGRVLTGAGQVRGELVSTSSDPNLKLNGAAVDLRSAIRAELVALVRLVAQERGVCLPTRRLPRPRPEGFIGPMPPGGWGGALFVDPGVSALAAFLARHAEWLAAHRAAGEHASALRALVRESWPVAFPSGTRLFPIRVPGARGVASCPSTVVVRTAFAVDRRGRASEVFGPVPCSGSLWSLLPGDDRLPRAVLCNASEAHRWETRSWLRVLGPAVVRALAEQALVEQLAAPAGPVLPVVRDVVVRRVPSLPLAEQVDAWEALAAATQRRPSGRGFVLVCRACRNPKADVPGAVEDRSGWVGEVGWGVPVDALLGLWERHRKQCRPLSTVDVGRVA